MITLSIFGAMAQTADPRPQAKSTVWDGVYAKVPSGAFRHNEFLARVVSGRSPGRALDIGAGEGRNAFFLASQGWDVTGFDASAEGVRLTRAEAGKRGLKVTAVVGDVDTFDYGRERWDLVIGLYMHEMVSRNAAKIAAALKPGGILVVEGMQYAATGTGVEGAPYGYRANELLRAFEGLRVLFYEEATASPYWRASSPAVPIVRFVAVREN